MLFASRLSIADHTVSRFWLVCLLAACLPLWTAAAELSEPSAINLATNIEAQLQALEADPALTSAQKAVIGERLQQALTQLENIEQLESQTQAYRNQRSTATEDIRLANEQLSSLDGQQPAAIPQTASFKELESQLAEAELLLSRERSELDSLEHNIREETAFDVPRALETARANVDTTLPGVDVDSLGETGNPGLQLANSIKLELRRKNIAMLEQRQLNRVPRLSLLEAQQRLQQRRVALTSTRVEQLKAAIASHRQNAAAINITAAQDYLESLKEVPDVLQKLANELLERARENNELVSRLTTVQQERLRVNRERARQEAQFRSLSQQLGIAALNAVPEFGSAVREQRDQLSASGASRKALRKREKTLTRARLSQFQIDALREAGDARDPELLAASLLEQAGSGLSQQQRALITPLANDWIRVLDELASNYTRYIDELGIMQSVERTAIAHRTQFAGLLDQHLLWMPSADDLSPGSLTRVWPAATELAQSTDWAGITQTLTQRIMSQPFVTALVVLVILGLLRRRGGLKAHLAATQDLVGHVNRDTFLLTPKALLATIALAAPGPITVYALAMALDEPDSVADALSHALKHGAAVYFVAAFALQCVRENGLATAHFNWPKNTVGVLRRNLPWLIGLVIPAIILNLFIEQQGSESIRHTLGRIVFIAGVVLVSLFAFRVLNPDKGLLQLRAGKPTDNRLWFRRYILFPLLVLLPLVVAVLSASGYHYTALELHRYLMQSLLVVLAGLLSFHVFFREFSVRERRLALIRIRAQRQANAAQSEDREAAEAAGEATPHSLDYQQIDLQTLSQQTKTLLKAAVALAVAYGLWTIWSTFLPAFKPLDGVSVWQVNEMIDGAATVIDITLWDVCRGLLILGLTILAARNIPGLLEIAVLSNFTLETGTSYAITSICRYLILIVGSIIALQVVGAQWSKLQWLIAALSVGLGFGLQEIVANFVSGIVLLFERPIRIGDTVTVGDQSGTVSKIQIRATTIVDWDRREIVIPNKIFITERLVNWTLTDPITRRTISVGVAYGSDIELVERLLLDVAESEVKVLDDPPPVALFLNFGESTLDFELRVFVRGIREMIPVTHALHVAIDKTFREHNVEIAFPQRDVHFDTEAVQS